MSDPRYLLDTSVAIHLLTSNAGALSPGVIAAIEDSDNDVAVSAISYWEIAIKRSAGKLDFPDDWAARLRSLELRPLPLNALHAERVESLPWHHRDPFDRALIAQALIDNLTVVTPDRAFSHYGVEVLR